MACVVLEDGTGANIDELGASLKTQVAKWWLPERWVFVDAILETSVGRFDEEVLRTWHAEGKIDVLTA